MSTFACSRFHSIEVLITRVFLLFTLIKNVSFDGHSDLFHWETTWSLLHEYRKDLSALAWLNELKGKWYSTSVLLVKETTVVTNSYLSVCGCSAHVILVIIMIFLWLHFSYIFILHAQLNLNIRWTFLKVKKYKAMLPSDLILKGRMKQVSKWGSPLLLLLLRHQIQG